jgi:hypothetical protein
MRGAPDIVALPKVAEPDQVRWLDSEIARFERDCGIAIGSTRLLPNIEFARGLVQTAAIAKASPRVEACLLASEDLAADLGAERGRDGLELAYARQRFLVECVAAGVGAVDAPYTWRDAEGVERDTAGRDGGLPGEEPGRSRARGDRQPRAHAPDEIAHARRLMPLRVVARERGEPRAELDGSLVEVPAWRNASGLLARAAELADAHPTPAARRRAIVQRAGVSSSSSARDRPSGAAAESPLAATAGAGRPSVPRARAARTALGHGELASPWRASPAGCAATSPAEIAFGACRDAHPTPFGSRPSGRPSGPRANTQRRRR